MFCFEFDKLGFESSQALNNSHMLNVEINPKVLFWLWRSQIAFCKYIGAVSGSQYKFSVEQSQMRGHDDWWRHYRWRAHDSMDWCYLDRKFHC